MDQMDDTLQITSSFKIDTTQEYHSNEFHTLKALKINKYKYKTGFIYLRRGGGGCFSFQKSLLSYQVISPNPKGTCNLHYVIHFLNKKKYISLTCFLYFFCVAQS